MTYMPCPHDHEPPATCAECARDSARDLAMQALGDAIEKPHGGRLAEALEAIARFIEADRHTAK